MTQRWLVTALCLALLGCEGGGTFTLQRPQLDPVGGGGGGTVDPNLPPTSTPLPGISGGRRLTRAEYDNAVGALLSDWTGTGAKLLPEESLEPFDNDYRNQLASQALIESLDAAAQEIATRVVANTALRATLVGCTPTGPGDAACLRQFITTFGRRAFRRPLAPSEVDRYLALQALAVEAGSFWKGVEFVLRGMLQSVHFLYRFELGEPTTRYAGAVKLTPYELATRLSFAVIGTVPPAWLLDETEAGRLGTPADVRAAAERLLVESDPTAPTGKVRARANVFRFHALWLGYSTLPHDAALSALMREETNGLLRKLVFEDRADYRQLFTAPGTFVNPALATHYGLPAPATAGFSWVEYGAAPRKGILSHATVLAMGAKFTDTSPTLRGLLIQERLFCRTIPPPPPGVDTDNPPEPDSNLCKVDRYVAHRENPGCASCHAYLDGIGFGLENFGIDGKYRTHEAEKPSCAIEGRGEFPGVGSFQGVGELADLAVASGDLEPCVTKHLFQFVMGRPERVEDAALLEHLAYDFRQHRKFDQLLLDLVSDETFAYRVPEN